MKTFFGRVIAVIIGITLFLGLVFAFTMGLAAVLGGGDEVKVAKKSVLEIKLDQPITESDMEVEASFGEIGKQNRVHYLQLLEAIEKAKTDDDIKGISIHIGTVMQGNISQIKTLRDALVDFKSSGKFVYAYSKVIGQKGYYLSSVADSIFHNPMGNIEFKGLASEVMFYKNMGEKYGIEFEVIRHGKYKSAVEPFIRENLSEENKEQLNEIINGLWDVVATDIAESRKLTVSQVNQAADSLSLFAPLKAKSLGFVDVLAQESDYTDFLKEKLEVKEDKELETIALADYAKTVKSDYNSDKIGVLYAQGMILPGDGFNGIQSETYKETIQDMANDEKIKAVVLRVNSGGGDAITSEEILYELKKLKEKKPLIVSFGDVAASGGYYISMANDGLLCEPTTITGSIGVLGMMPNIKGLANNVGITTDYVTTHPNAVFYSPFNGLSEGAKTKLKENVEIIYQQFITHVSEGRNMPLAQTDSLGQGRVYTGMQAKELGLVDDLGTLSDAIELAAEKAELSEYQLKAYPKRTFELEDLLKELNLSVELKNQLKNSENAELWKLYLQIDQLQKIKGAAMLMPYDYNIQ